ncbi:NAD-dependent epimerase/dehydratase family protein [Profundibacter amoris]|uniref:NAD(P)-dependent oxidoreductase n=1 Tax=Profundibacter amoris TaxID=2171755 RepID=A0A347UFU1_9RHOB|nr:NAD(P)-dependent oxidoreductase [Profundibacter amoris]AXX97719.1 NAD(P)-dependent oxidoreductase [Profundibacter amoris]
MTKPVLLTGATGFVGRQILRALLNEGKRVRLVVRTGHDDALASQEGIERVVVTTPDLFAESADWWQETCKGVDTIIHAAWYAEPGKYLTSPKNLDCLAGTIAMAQGAMAAGLRRFVGVGTCFEYDVSVGDLTTDTPLAPQSPYAGAKAAAFLALSQALPVQDVEFAWCRLFYLYGEGEDARRFVPYLRGQLEKGEVAELTSGKQWRDFMDVRRAGDMIAQVAMGKVTGAVNVCSGQAITIRQLAERIADEYDRRDLLKFGARPDNLVDPPRVVGVPTVL